jgi:hypothetical protein
MKSSKLISVISSLFCVFTVLPAQSQLKEIRLEEVLAVAEIEGEVVYQKVGVAADDEGNIYLTDIKSIKKFNKVGQLIGEIGIMGAGPGAFNGESLIKYYNNKIYVTDSRRPGIYVYDKNLDFKYKIPLRFTITDLNFISDDRVAVSALRRDRSEEGDFLFCIYTYDSKGEETEKIIYSTSKNFTMMNMINFRIDRRNNLLVVYCWKDKIEKFDRNGNLLWTRSLLEGKSARTGRQKGTKLTLVEYPLEAVYRAIALDTNGNLFILGGDLSENRGRDVYVLNENGEYLMKFTLAESSHSIYIDSKNCLYSRSENGLMVRKYALEYVYE